MISILIGLHLTFKYSNYCIVRTHRTLNTCQKVISESDLMFIDEKIFENLKQSLNNISSIVATKNSNNNKKLQNI